MLNPISNPDLFKSEVLEIIKDKSKWRSCSPDNPFCAICLKIITDIPLRLFNENYEITFHPECALNGLIGEKNEEDEKPSGFSCLDCDQIQICKYIPENLRKKSH